MEKDEIEQAIAELEAANGRANSGRGSSPIRQIISYLRRNLVEEAKAEYAHDGDKLTQYAELDALVVKWFGCRLHLIRNCQRAFCVQLRKFL